jgi:uncharacterized protein (TIGR02117 family)
MPRRLALFFCFLCAGWIVACASDTPLGPSDDGPRTQLVHVFSNGWHTAIIVPRGDLVETGLLPEADDFSEAAFIELGWGDREYYPARDKTLSMTLAAALTPTPSVMHVAGLVRAPRPIDGETDVLSVLLTKAALRRLVETIAQEFVRPESGRAPAVSRGLYPDSNFYDARGEFHLFNTCNNWTARALRAGGIDVSAEGIITADGLVDRLRVALKARVQEVPQ